MYLFNHYRSRKYLVRLILSSLLILLLFVSVVTGALVYNAENNAMKMLEDSNRKVLSQIGYNINFTNSMFIQFLISLYFDNDINVLMKRDDSDYFELIPRLFKLDKTVESTNYIHSILVYNGTEDNLYSSGDYRLRDPESSIYRAFRQLLDGKRETSKLMLMPVEYESGGRTNRLFSMLMYDSSGSHKARENAIVINIEPDWVMNSLVELNKPNNHFSNAIIIVDGKGDIYQSTSHFNVTEEALKAAVAPHLETMKSSASPITIDGPNDKWVATPLQVKAVDWQVITLQSYDEVMSGIHKLRQSSIVVVLLFLATAVIVSFISAHRLYRPVENLMRQFGSPVANAPKSGGSRWEFSVINDSYNHVMNQLNTLKQVYSVKRDAVKSYYLQRLLSMKDSVTETEFDEFQKQYHFKLNPDGPYAIMLMSFVLDRGDNKLMQFAVANIAKEIVGNRFNLEMIELHDGTVAALVNLPSGVQRGNGDLYAAVQEMQAVIFRYYHIPVAVAVSRIIADYREFAKHYTELRRLLEYRLVFGEGAIIEAETVSAGRKTFDPSHLEELEKKLVESMRAAQASECEKWIASYFHYLKQLEIEHVDYGITRLILTLSKELASIAPHSGTFRANPILRRVMQQSSLDDMMNRILEDVRAAMKEQHTEENRKYILLCDTIKDIAHQKFADPNLSLQTVSELLKMTPTYVGRIFKSICSQSFADYLNEIRLELALQLLKNGNSTIKEIMESVGYSSQSNFFRLFKLKYGAPPKEYRLLMITKKSD